MVEGDKRAKHLEIAFTVGFSALVFALFFSFLGANGVVLGNDPAVHLQRAQDYLNAGRIQLSGVAFLSPLYHLVLATFMAFTGATSGDQVLVLVKAVTALVDWLLVFSVYLIAAKFFSKKTGVFAAALLLLCFPLYEINSWGGYTSILAMAFMLLTFTYLASPLKSRASALVIFILAFCVVMSHELATFLAIFVLPPFVILVLVRSKGHYPKALLAAILGGGIAFLIYYLLPILPYLGDLIYIVFFQIKTMLYQIPAVTFDKFMMNFGFLLFFAFAGLAIAFFDLRKRKSLGLYLLLAMAFLVPLFFSQSYLVGFFLPFQFFVYYLMPPLAVLGGVALSFLVDAAWVSYFNNRRAWKKFFLKAISIVIVVVLVAVIVVRFQTLSGKIAESVVSYSTSDVAAYEAGSWIRMNFPDRYAKVVATEHPGHWFGIYAGRPVIAETGAIVDWVYTAESVLDLSYEMNHPLTFMRAYEAKGNLSDQTYVMQNMVWTPAVFFPEDGAILSFRDENDTLHTYPLSTLNREISFDQLHSPKRLTVQYLGEGFVLTENVLMENDTYPVTVTWQLSALDKDLNYASLYLSEYFDAKLEFDQAYVPGVLDWESPWNNASKVDERQWAVTSFYTDNLREDNCIDVYDSTNQVAFGLKFSASQLPDLGNIGALANRNIDAIRFEYRFFKINANYTVTVSYQTLAFALSSYPELKDYRDMNTLFSLKTSELFTVDCRNFASLIRDNYVGFVVYSAERFDPSVLKTRWLELVYSNDKYFVLKINTDHPYVAVVENVTATS